MSGGMENRPIVVLVDADDAFASAVRESFGNHGYAVERHRDVASAAARVRQLKPDIVITDMILPGDSGFRLLERLKGGDRTLPIIMTASFCGLAHRRFAEFLGADDFLVKPVAVNRLLESVRRFCTVGLNPPNRSPLPSRLQDVAVGT